MNGAKGNPPVLATSTVSVHVRLMLNRLLVKCHDFGTCLLHRGTEILLPAKGSACASLTGSANLRLCPRTPITSTVCTKKDEHLQMALVGTSNKRHPSSPHSPFF